MDIFSCFPPQISHICAQPSSCSQSLLLFYVFKGNVLSKPLDVPGSNSDTKPILCFVSIHGARCPRQRNQTQGQQVCTAVCSNPGSAGPENPRGPCRAHCLSLSLCVPFSLQNELPVQRLALCGAVEIFTASR